MRIFNRKPNRNERRRIIKGELRNVDVDLISLLFDAAKPANMKGAVIKSADGKKATVLGASAKFKAETSGGEGKIYVTIMEPDVVDAQGDTYSAQEIEKAAYHFSEKGLVGKNDINHNNQPVPEFFVAETGILKAADALHYPDTKIGSWVACLKCKDLTSTLWDKVQKGLFNGVSIAGWAEDSDSDNSTAIAELKSMLSELKKILEPEAPASANSAPQHIPPAAQTAITTIENRIKELEKSSPADSSELIKAFTLEMKELTTAMKKAIKKSLGGEPGEDHSDKEVTVAGVKVLVKSTHAEIYKAIGDVDSGSKMNILTPNTTGLFIDEVIESKSEDTLSDITVLEINKDNKIDAGLVQDLVFTNSLDTAAAAQAIGELDITVSPGILTAEMTLLRDTVEFYKEKYGEQAFGAYVEQHIAKKAEKAIRKLLFRGDRAAAAGVTKALDGIIKIATTGSDVTSIDSELYVTYVEKFEAALKSFSEDMLEEQANFVMYVSFKDLISIRSELAQRETNKGDLLLMEGGKVSFAGIPIKARLMADNYIVMGLPKFIIIGYRTDAEMKVEHHGDDWKYHWYLRLRAGITYLDGFVKVFLIS
jgi:hypothetical protein